MPWRVMGQPSLHGGWPARQRRGTGQDICSAKPNEPKEFIDINSLASDRQDLHRPVRVLDRAQPGRRGASTSWWSRTAAPPLRRHELEVINMIYCHVAALDQVVSFFA